jgi:hypothetical protein
MQFQVLYNIGHAFYLSSTLLPFPPSQRDKVFRLEMSQSFTHTVSSRSWNKVIASIKKTANDLAVRELQELVQKWKKSYPSEKN